MATKKKKKHPLAGTGAEIYMRDETTGEAILWQSYTYDDDGNQIFTYKRDDETTKEWEEKMLANISKKASEIVSNHPECGLHQYMKAKGITSMKVNLIDILGLGREKN